MQDHAPKTSLKQRHTTAVYTFFIYIFVIQQVDMQASQVGPKPFPPSGLVSWW